MVQLYRAIIGCLPLVLVLVLGLILDLARPAYSAGPIYIDEQGAPFEIWRKLASGKLKNVLADPRVKSLSPEARHFWTGLMYLKERDYELANAEFEKCGKIDRLSDFAVKHVAESYIGAEEYDNAMPFLNKLAAHNPDDVSLHFMRGDILFAKGKLADAAVEYKKAGVENTTYSIIPLGRAAECMRVLHRYDEGVKVATQAIALKHWPDHAKIFLTRALCYKGLGKLKLAEDDLTSAIKYGHERTASGKQAGDIVVSGALEERANLYKQMGRFDLARKDREAQQKYGKSVESDFFGK